MTESARHRRIKDQLPVGSIAALLAQDMRWMLAGRCVGLAGRADDPWFPEADQREQTRSAKRMCRACPVKTRCLRFALDGQIEHGVWGMTTPRERRAMLAHGVAA